MLAKGGRIHCDSGKYINESLRKNGGQEGRENDGVGEFSIRLDVEEWRLKQHHSSQQSSVNTDTESGQSEEGAAHKMRKLGEMSMLIIVALRRPRQKD